MTIDEKYMARAIQLAKNGRQNAVPNPMVGAVIVLDGKIIGEGYHIRCGEGHAEVNAVASVKDKSLLKDATIYVSLEPCAHFGKTPPCAQLLIDHKLKRVVVGCVDPFAKVQGKGIQMLRFFTFHQKQRPYITLKWAQSADGFIYNKDADRYLSNPRTLMLVHKMRAESQAILVGSRTAETDNPRLDVRLWHGKNPTRIVIDRQNRLSRSLSIFDGSTPTIVFTTSETDEKISNVEFVTLKAEDFLNQMLAELHKRQIQSLLVEGGRELHQLFIDNSLWDEIRVEESDIVLGGGIEAPAIPSGAKAERKVQFGHTITTFRNAE